MVTEEELEEIELGAGQFQQPGAASDDAARRVKVEVGEPEGITVRGTRARSPQEGAKTGQEFFEGKGLDEIIIGAGIKTGDAVCGGVTSGEHQDRGVVPGRPQPAAHLESVDAGHADVEQDGIGGIVQQLVEGTLAVDGHPYLVTLKGQGALERLSDCRLVIDDKYTHVHQRAPCS
ncbi:MAG: hypothetical protein NVS3B12_00200 [Acidimicrobiales bacterium]